MLRLCLSALAALFLALPAFANEDSNPSSAELQTVLEKSDRLFREFNYEESRELLEAAAVKFPNAVEVLWRLSSVLIHTGDMQKDRKPYYTKAIHYAEAAVKADSNNAQAHALLAASYGSYAMFAGGKEKVKLANTIRDELDAALRIDPDNEVAHTVYGTWHREVASVGWFERQLANMFLGSLPKGSYEKSVAHFKKAIQAGPSALRHRFELGLTYIEMDREDLALKTFKEALQYPDGLKRDANRRKRMQKFIEENDG